ncbi:hypothetical protein RFI_02356, partial [Reticulomyxa filosa]
MWDNTSDRDKSEIVDKFKSLSNKDFGKWFQTQSKWKFAADDRDIPIIRFITISYISIFDNVCVYISSKLQVDGNEKAKVVSNPLVIMIAISDYDEKEGHKSLKNVKESDVKHFKGLFKDELKYDFVCNSNMYLTEAKLRDYWEEAIKDNELRRNVRKYDGVIVIICGHGTDKDELVTSDGKYFPISDLKDDLDCSRMESLKDCPKIFVVDICRGATMPKACPTPMAAVKTRGTAQSKIQAQLQSEWYCVEIQSTVDYEIVFANHNNNNNNNNKPITTTTTTTWIAY